MFFIAENNIGVRNYRLSAVIVIGKVFIYGKNQAKTHPSLRMKGKQNPHVEFSSTHAEMDALLRARRLFSDDKWDKIVKKTRIYVARVNNSGNKSLAKPCLNCQKELESAGFLPKNVFFTDSNGNWTCLKNWDRVS